MTFDLAMCQQIKHEQRSSGVSIGMDAAHVLSLRQLRYELESLEETMPVQDFLLSKSVGRANRLLGPRAVCALITQLGRAKHCAKVSSI